MQRDMDGAAQATGGIFYGRMMPLRVLTDAARQVVVPAYAEYASTVLRRINHGCSGSTPEPASIVSFGRHAGKGRTALRAMRLKRAPLAGCCPGARTGVGPRPGQRQGGVCGLAIKGWHRSSPTLGFARYDGFAQPRHQP